MSLLLLETYCKSKTSPHCKSKTSHIGLSSILEGLSFKNTRGYKISRIFAGVPNLTLCSRFPLENVHVLTSVVVAFGGMGGRQVTGRRAAAKRFSRRRNGRLEMLGQKGCRSHLLAAATLADRHCTQSIRPGLCSPLAGGG